MLSLIRLVTPTHCLRLLLCLVAVGLAAPQFGLAQDAPASTATDSADTAAASFPEIGDAAISDAAAEFPMWRPIVAMCVGVTVVLTLMIGLKTHAFVALILGALVISCFVPLDVVGFVKSPVPDVVRDAEQASPAQIVNRVTNSLGAAVTGIGVLIAMAAIIGKCMLVSGAADRIVKSTLAVFGEKRAALAMMVSGFVLSIPVFFDTVFYLLVPLARSLYRRTGKNYLLYLGAIAAGGAITHTLVPPTPGPLLVASTLQVSVGMVMMIGLVVGAPSAVIGLLAASWLNKVMPIEMRPMAGASQTSTEEQEFSVLPSLPLALTPVVLPVVLISLETIYSTIYAEPEPGSTTAAIKAWLQLFGNSNFAMILAALCAIFTCWKVQGYSLRQLADYVEDALLSGGVIILITAAGGAFGGLLAMTQIQEVVKSFFEGNAQGGLIVIVVAYALAAILKIAQGSSTVSMIISSSLVASIALPLVAEDNLGFHPAYLVPVIGSGSLMGSWMNDSGFWVFAKMGVLTEGETLRSWTVLLSILSVSGFVIATTLATLFPLV